VRSLMAASELFARAASAKPPSPPAGAQPGSGTSGPVVQNSGSPATAKPGDTPSQPVAENKPVEADRPPPVVRPPGPEPAERPVESPVPAPRGIGRGGSTPPQDADVAAIRGVLAQFEAGYRSLDAAAIRQVWPSAPAVNFNGVRSYEVTLQQADITLQGDTARVTCIRQVKVQNAAGKAQEARQRVTFTLHRGPAGWVILSVQ
jgi:ketosteroid isomerase-like protein